MLALPYTFRKKIALIDNAIFQIFEDMKKTGPPGRFPDGPVLDYLTVRLTPAYFMLAGDELPCGPTSGESPAFLIFSSSMVGGIVK